MHVLALSKLKSKIRSFGFTHVVSVLDACVCHVILKLHWHKVGQKIVAVLILYDIESKLCHLISIFVIVLYLLLDDIDSILHGNKIM